MKRRRRHESPFSLFAFQDIITSVTGILLLMTLIITLALITRQLDSPSVQSLVVAEEVSRVLSETRSDIILLEQQFETAQQEITGLADISALRVRRELSDLEQQMAGLAAQISSLKEKVSNVQATREQWKPRERSMEENRQLLKQLEQELKRLQQERQKLEEDDRLIYNPQQSSSKAAWLVDVSSSQVQAARVGVAEAPQQFASVRDFLRWAESRDTNREYFVLLVRPDGIQAYQEIFVRLTKADYDLGIDLIGQDQTVIDPKQGAGKEG